jgi:hypothetical protein
MNRILSSIFFLGFTGCVMVNCSNEEVSSTQSLNGNLSTTVLDVAQTSGQLASGTSFSINGSSTDSLQMPGGHHGHHDHHAILDGLNLLAPTEELLTIIDAESASDFRGMRIFKNGGAIITNYDVNGNTVSLPMPGGDGPQGCSFSGKQFADADSVLATIVKTVIDFGTGVTYNRDTLSITRSGKIVITRAGDKTNMTEVTSFDNYFVNGNKIEGTKTRISTFDETSGNGTSITTVTDGKITFSDGSVALWTSDKSRSSSIVLDASTNQLINGTISTEVNTKISKADGTVIYAHVTTKPLIENIACDRRRHGPVSGTLETTYGSDDIVVDYGDGSCSNQKVSITINGVTTTKTIGE